MQFSPDRAKEGAIDTGAAVVGAVATLAIINKVGALIAQKSPSSTIPRHVPAIMLGLGLALQAFDVVPQNDMVDSALQGSAVVAGMQSLREYTGANTAAGMTATTGIAALINTYVPAFQQDGTAPALPAAALDASAALQGLGAAYTDYSEPANVLVAAGREQQMMNAQPRNLGTPAPQPKFLG
jgi:hypothetical protein